MVNGFKSFGEPKQVSYELFFFTIIIIICKIENQTASMGHKVFIFHVPNGHDLDVVYAHAGNNTIPPNSDFLC